MSNAKKSWIWFLLLMTGTGICSGMGRRAELGQSFAYPVEEYRKVDPALIRYAEVEPIVPTIKKLSALTIAPDGRNIERRAGLGLPLVRQLIEAHQGTIELMSEPGQGTSAVVVLP